MASSEKTALRRGMWKRRILETIRNNENASRILVKRQQGLSMGSALGLIEELLQENLIVAIGKSAGSGAGRKATLLKINEDGCYFIGVRFSAAGVWGVCTDFGHRAVCTHQEDMPPQQDGEALIEAISRCIEALMTVLGERAARLRGIGLGGPGIIDPQAGVIVRYAHIPDWENVPIREIIEKRFGLPTYLEHGVKCTARALLALPERQDIRDLLFMQISRGVGLCAVIGGRVHYGTHFLAGEVAQTPTESGETLEALLRAAAKAGGALGETAGRAAGDILAVGIMLLNPQEVVLSGDLCRQASFCKALRERAAEKCLPESLKDLAFTFLPADGQRDAVGAAALPYDKQFGWTAEDNTPEETENAKSAS